MSGVDVELTSMTEKLIKEVDAVQGEDSDAQVASLLRGFVAQARKRIHRYGGGDEGKKDILTELEGGWKESAPEVTITLPSLHEADEKESFKAKCRRLASGKFALALGENRPPRVGAVLAIAIEDWGTNDVETKKGVIIQVEPAWDAAGEKCFLCEVEMDE